jgi:hypothetical protein
VFVLDTDAITHSDIEGIKDSVLAEVASIRGERAGTAFPIHIPL